MTHPDRPWNHIDAMAMGQEDYRQGKPLAKPEFFERRVHNSCTIRRIRLCTSFDMATFYQFYREAYEGTA